MKLFRYIYPLVAAFALFSCSDEVTMPFSPVDVDNGTLKIDISLDIAEFAASQSRSFTDKPNYGGLELHVLEFKYSDDPISNEMTNNYNLREGAVGAGVVNEDGDIHFTLTLEATDEPRVLHFIAVPKGTYQSIGSTNEGMLIPSLTVDQETPAYWQRIVFENGYGTYDNDDKFTRHADLDANFVHIPMLCNFAKITLAKAPGAAFDILGFAIVNQPAFGTVAPWNRTTANFPAYNNGSTLKSYSDITASGYSGYWPFDHITDIVNKTAPESYDMTSKFIYEIPHSTLNSPLIIMRAKPAGATDYYYYKLDLGNKIEDKNSEDRGSFVFYNILRNFSYNVTVKTMDAAGYATPEEALAGVVFNNFSFDVNTMQMQNISDGANMLWVNNTTFVVTNESEREVKILFRFSEGINTGTPTDKSGRVKIRDLETGEAIESIPANLDDLPTENGWKVLTLTTVAPSDETKRQSFIIIDPETGLGRTINVIVRNPWQYKTPTLYGVNYNTYDQYLTTVADYSAWDGFVSNYNWSATNQQPLTVGFFIDNDIQEAMFPLQFVYEANPQVIENNKDGNLLVNTGESLFTSTNHTIRYVKTITWADYNTELKDSPTGLKVINGNQELHFVRARFLTTTSLTTNTTYTVRVYNPYFRVNATTPYLDLTFRPSTLNQNGPNPAGSTN